jgi:hypothetical protein
MFRYAWMDVRGLVDREMHAKSERISGVTVFPIDVKRDQMTNDKLLPNHGWNPPLHICKRFASIQTGCRLAV